MKYDLYGSNLQPRKTRKAPLVVACAIAAIVLFYGWMGGRDAEPQLSVLTYDCAPSMEMSMPIDVGRVQL